MSIKDARRLLGEAIATFDKIETPADFESAIDAARGNILTAGNHLENELYNGWSNRETWAMALHIGNTEAFYREAREMAETVRRGVRSGRIATKERAQAVLAEKLKELWEPRFEAVYHGGEPAGFDLCSPMRQTPKDWRMAASDVGSIWRVDWREIARHELEE